MTRRRPLVIAGKVIHDDHALNRWLNRRRKSLPIRRTSARRASLRRWGATAQRDMLEKLGFFKQVDFELGERSRPQYPPLANWGELATMTIGYGHGMAVTPLHLAAGYAALVNGGIYHNPTLIKPAPGRPIAGRRVFKARHVGHDARAAAAGGHHRHRAARPMRRAIASAARPAPPKRSSTAAMCAAPMSRPLLLPSRWTHRAMSS